MAYDLNILTSIRKIASQAYGSGFFEKEKGGEGYMGAFVGSDGTVRVAKMLTHWNEYGAVKKAGGEAQFAKANQAMAESCAKLKDVLLKIAEKSDNRSIRDSVDNLLAGKSLLDRKVVAKVVTELTRGLSEEDFSWKEAAKGARTFGDTTLDAVSKAYDEVRTSLTPNKDVTARFTDLTADILREEVLEAKSADECAEQIRAGQFSRSWLKSPVFHDLSTSLHWQLESLFDGDSGSDGFNSPELNAGTNALDMNVESAKEDSSSRIFHKVLREALAGEVKAKGVYPLTKTQMLRLMARAYKKAYIMTRVYFRAKSVLNKIEKKFAPTNGSNAVTAERTGRSGVIAGYRAKLDDPGELLTIYNRHFSVEALRDDPTIKKDYQFMSVSLVGKIMAGDVLGSEEFWEKNQGECDSGDLSEIPTKEGKERDDDMANLFQLFDDSAFAGAKKLFLTRVNQCAGMLIPGVQSLNLGGAERSDLNSILNDPDNRFVPN